MARSNKRFRTEALGEWLDLAGKACKEMKDAQEYQEYRRDEFIGIIRAAKIAGATQQNIADASGLSRQRIQQLLKKSNRTGS